MEVEAAVRDACRYVEAAIRYAPGLGKGHGPLGHFHSLSSLPFSRDHFLDYVLERPDVVELWQRFVNHPFVKALGAGSLPRESFKGYLIQDYLYLVCILSGLVFPPSSTPIFPENQMKDVEWDMLTGIRYTLHEQADWLRTSPKT